MHAFYLVHIVPHINKYINSFDKNDMNFFLILSVFPGFWNLFEEIQYYICNGLGHVLELNTKYESSMSMKGVTS